MPLSDVKTLEQLVAGRTLLLPRLAAGLSGLFAALALALAMVGLYGVVAYSVACRVREIGIRMSLGASRSAVLRLVLGQGALLALLGTGIGLALAAAATRVLGGLLFGVGSSDPLTFAAVPGLLIGVAVLAAFVPARRATRLDPALALRDE
jgi:putative ABC transport system permease protein